MIVSFIRRKRWAGSSKGQHSQGSEKEGFHGCDSPERMMVDGSIQLAMILTISFLQLGQLCSSKLNAG